jgi:hypothetical protein
MVVAFGLGSGACLVCFFCSNQLISGIDFYTCHEVVGSLTVYFIYVYCIDFILFIVLWDITHAALLQHLVGLEPLFDSVEAQLISNIGLKYHELTRQSAQAQY